jgi:hypothetical protein
VYKTYNVRILTRFSINNLYMEFNKCMNRLSDGITRINSVVISSSSSNPPKLFNIECPRMIFFVFFPSPSCFALALSPALLSATSLADSNSDTCCDSFSARSALSWNYIRDVTCLYTRRGRGRDISYIPPIHPNFTKII